MTSDEELLAQAKAAIEEQECYLNGMKNLKRGFATAENVEWLDEEDKPSWSPTSQSG